MIKPIAKRIKWEVADAPTGQYRSFFQRGWPTACIGVDVVASIRCADEYIPANVRSGKHAELTARVAIREAGKQQFEFKLLKKRAATLDEAKALVADFFERYPQYLGDIAP